MYVQRIWLANHDIGLQREADTTVRTLNPGDKGSADELSGSHAASNPIGWRVLIPMRAPVGDVLEKQLAASKGELGLSIRQRWTAVD